MEKFPEMEHDDPMAIRLTLLRHHYRSDWEWTDAERNRRDRLDLRKRRRFRLRLPHPGPLRFRNGGRAQRFKVTTRTKEIDP